MKKPRRDRARRNRTKAAPFEMSKSATGRYTVTTVERALKLRRENVEAWRKLPAKLRHEAEQAERISQEMAAQLREQARAVEDWNRQHPKVLRVIERIPGVGALELPDADELEKCLKLPGRRGRKVSSETLKRIELIRERRAESPARSWRRIAHELYPNVPVETAENNLRRLRRYHKL